MYQLLWQSDAEFSIFEFYVILVLNSDYFLKRH
jgi:hypothetical protein